MNTKTGRIESYKLRGVRLALASMGLICTLGFFQPSYADGIYRFTNCYRNTSNVATGTGFTATVDAKTMTEWSGASAKVGNVNGKPTCMYADPKQRANLFGNTAAGGTDKFMENFINGTKVIPQDFMMFSFIAPKGTKLVPGTVTLFDVNNNNAPVQTGLHSNFRDVKADPILDFTNPFSFSETLDFVGAFFNNSQDPLDASINFVADGTPISPITSSPGCEVGASIAPNQTCEFSFDLPPGTRNWAFEIFADAGSDFPIFDLVATTIPESPSVVLLGFGLLGLLIDVRKIARRASWAIEAAFR